MNVDRHKVEANAIGAQILGHDVQLTPAVFEVDAHATIHKHIRKIRKAGDPLDIVTLAESLSREGVLDEVGGLPYLGKIVSETPAEQ